MSTEFSKNRFSHGSLRGLQHAVRQATSAELKDSAARLGLSVSWTEDDEDWFRSANQPAPQRTGDTVLDRWPHELSEPRIVLARAALAVWEAKMVAQRDVTTDEDLQSDLDNDIAWVHSMQRHLEQAG